MYSSDPQLKFNLWSVQMSEQMELNHVPFTWMERFIMGDAKVDAFLKAQRKRLRKNKQQRERRKAQKKLQKRRVR